MIKTKGELSSVEIEACMFFWQAVELIFKETEEKQRREEAGSIDRDGILLFPATPGWW